MATSRTKRLEVTSNYEVFLSDISTLLPESRGKYVVYRHQHMVGIFDNFYNALTHCALKYEDQLYSIQEITDEPLDTGTFYHANFEGAV